MSYKIRHFAIAAGLTALAAFLTILYVANDRAADKRAVEQVTVYVAGKTISPGTSGAEIADDDVLKTQLVSRNAAAPGAITDPAALAGLIANETTYNGEQVIAQRFKPAAEEGIRAEIKGRLRVVELPGDQHQVLAGTLEAGDRVDVIGTWALPEGGANHVSGVVLRGVRVLEPADGPGDSELGEDETVAVKLAVNEDQAQRLLWITKHGSWMLDLRPVRKARDAKVAPVAANTLLSSGVSR